MITRDVPALITLHWEEDYGADGGWSWKNPDFKRGLVDELKEAIPKDDRSYDPVNQIWTVGAEHADTVTGLLEEWFKAEVIYDHTGCDYDDDYEE